MVRSSRWRSGCSPNVGRGDSLDDIAAAVGVGRRTLFRYFRWRNDIPWGRFNDGLADLARHLEAMPADLPVHEAVHRAVIEFNRLDPAAVDQHRWQMSLILSTRPALQAHSVLRYDGRRWSSGSSPDGSIRASRTCCRAPSGT